VEADVGQLGQVVNNLVINAAQAMPNGGIIRIQVRNVEQLQLENQQPRFGKFLAVSVIDHGIGIEKKNIRKIFDPYFTTKKKGSGLGLATAYSIIKQHEGFLVVKSKWREGSTFTFYLPATSSTPMISRKLQKVVSKGSGRILVMDDEAIILDMVSDLLGHLGYESVVVTDGEKAIEAYVTALKEDRPFRCVVMDLTIPGGLGGEETIKRLRAIDPEVVAIASTGYSNSPVVSDPQKYGFKGILPKPYDAEKLSDILNDLLRTD
jgi:CheY-like chemotaxis protein